MILKNKCVLIDNYDSFTYNLAQVPAYLLMQAYY